MERAPVRHVAAWGMVGWILLGLAGAVVPEGGPRDVLWLLSGVGLVTGGMAAAAVYRSKGMDLHAAGFMVLAIAEAVMIAGHNRATDPGADAGFATGVALYAAGFLLVGIPSGFAWWGRVAAVVSSVPFALHAILRAAGQELGSDGPYTDYGYALAFVAVVAFAVDLLGLQKSPS